jgi:hypothetical protein
MLAIGAVEKTELLLTMRRIISGINIQQNFPALTDLVATDANEVFAQLLVQAHQVAATDPVLPARERGLGTQRASQLLVGNDLQHRIMAQA